MQEDVSHYASPSTGRALTMAQRKKGRRAYLDSFHQTPSGDYIYTGATYSLANGSGRTAVRLAVLGAAAVGETVYLLLHGPEGLALGAAAYLLCQLGAAAAMLALRGAVLGLEYREER